MQMYLGMINHMCSCIFINFGIFVLIKLIRFDKIFENSDAGVALLLAKQSIVVLTN